MRLVLGCRAPLSNNAAHRRHAHAPRVGMGEQVVSSALVIEKSQHQGQEDASVVISSAAWSMSSNEHELLPPDDLVYQQDSLQQLQGRKNEPQQLLRAQLESQVYINGQQNGQRTQQLLGGEPVQVSVLAAKASAAPASTQEACLQGSAQEQDAASNQSAHAGVASSQLPHPRRHRVRKREPVHHQVLASDGTSPPLSLDAALAQLDELLMQQASRSGPSKPAAQWPSKQQQQQQCSAKQLLRAVQTAADITRAHDLWCKHQHHMQPYHTTAMWARLSNLVTGQEVSSGEPAAATPAVAALDSQLHGAGQQEQQQDVGGGGHRQQQLLMELVQRESSLRARLSPVVMSLWGELQHTTRFMAPQCSIAQLADILHAHAQLQQVLQQLDGMQHKMRQVQRPRNSSQQQQQGNVWHGSHRAATNGAAAARDDVTVKVHVNGHNTHGTQQPVAVVEVAADDAGRVAAGGGRSEGWAGSPVPAIPKRVRSEIMTLQHQHKQFVGDLLRLCAPQLQAATAGQLVLLLTCMVTLKHSAPKLWMDAWWNASLPLLPNLSPSHMQAVFRGVGHSGVQPPPAWCIALYAASKPQLASADVAALCVYAHGAARLTTRPGGAWLTALMSSCEEQFESLDAPAYALLLHALGRMQARPPTGWLQEFWDNSQGLLYDFTPQELCLLMKGAAYLGVLPEPHWQQSLWQESKAKFRVASAEQLAGLGWAVLVGLGLKPPKFWINAWLNAMHKRCMAGPPNRALQLRKGAAVRAAQTLALLQLEDLAAWCTRLRVPVPEARPSLSAVSAAAQSAASEQGGAAGAPDSWEAPGGGVADTGNVSEDEGSAHESGVAQGYTGSEGEEDVRTRVAALQAAFY